MQIVCFGDPLPNKKKKTKREKCAMYLLNLCHDLNKSSDSICDVVNSFSNFMVLIIILIIGTLPCLSHLSNWTLNKLRFLKENLRTNILNDTRVRFRRVF